MLGPAYCTADHHARPAHPKNDYVFKLRHLSADAETRRLAFVRERALLDERSLLKDAREEGREEGWKQGIEQGKAEALRQIAINLIRSSGLDDATIAVATGLSTTDIRTLRQQVW